MINDIPLETIREFVIASHGNRPKVEAMLAENPALLNVRFAEWDETPLGAASHVGNRDLAQYFLDQGAPLTVCTAAMLGWREEVRRLVAADPAEASARGAHGIPVLTHAAFSGDVELCAYLYENGDGAGLDMALHNAVVKGHLPLVDWLLEQGADPAARNWQDKTAAELAADAGQEAIAARLARG